ncbi:MAG TPA: hypothetical protein H9664_01060 [Firmicutes bacterium]|nr:hypothetical protein [Bacillota bacterium]
MNLLLLFLLMGKGINGSKHLDPKLLAELSPFMPLEARRGVRALCEYETCITKPDFYKGETSKNPEQLLKVIEHISRDKTPIMLFRLMSSMGRLKNIDPSSPEGLSAMLSAILPDEMRKNLPDIPTLINMINIVQSMSEEDTEEEESGHCENKESEEDYCPREIRTPMNPRQRRMFGQLLHRRR